MRKYIYIIKYKIKYLFNDGFFHILTGNTLTKAISFISTIAIVRIVEKEDYGNLVYADNLYSYVVILAGLGMASAVIIYCSREDDQLKENEFFCIALKYGGIVQIIGSVIILLYYFYFASGFRDAKYIMVVLFLYPTGSYIISCITSLMRADFRPKLYAKVSLLQTACVFVFSILFTICMGAIGIAFARYLSIIFVIIISIKFLKEKRMKFNCVKVLTQLEKKTFFTTAISLLVMNMFSQLMISNETMLVNALINNEIVTANYKVAILIPSQLIFITSSIAVYFFPKVAKMGAGEKVWRYSKRTGIYTTVLIVAIMAIAIPISPWIIQIVFGGEYVDATPLLKLFWIAYGINASIRMIPLNILPTIGREKFNAVVSIISCGAHFIIDYYCIINYGIYGVAIASIIVYTGSGIVAWGYLRYACKVNSLGGNQNDN